MYRCTPPLWPYNCMTGTRINWFNSGWLGICGEGPSILIYYLMNHMLDQCIRSVLSKMNLKMHLFLFQLFETFYYIDFDSKNNCFSRISAPFVKVNSTYMKHKV